MKNKILILLARLNFIFPNYLGYKYRKYGSFFKDNREKFDSLPLLLRTINYSKKSVPHYIKSNIKNIEGVKDFENNIPFIDKDVVMDKWNDFINVNLEGEKYDEGTTGGTSGKPLKLLMPKDRYIVEFNTVFSIWKQFGWNGHLRAVIRNKHLKENQTYTVDPITKQVIFDGFRTDSKYYEDIYQTIKKLKIKYIHAYPSSAYQFSLFLLKQNKDISFIKAFQCSSEGVTELQKQLITKQLGIPICEFYGHSEKLIIGGPCKGNDAIHIEPTYGYFELVDEEGKVINTSGKLGEMVGTTLHNPLMPLIRYKTGDYAEFVGNYCPSCNRHLPLIKNIQGRWDKNKIYLKDGTYISTTALNLHSDLYQYIDGMQYIQYDKKHLEIHLVKGDNFNDNILERFNDHFKKAFKGRCNFKIVFKTIIEKEPNGKFLPLKQLTSENN